MNYAVIQKNTEDLSLLRPVKCRKIRAGDKNILILRIKYKLLVYPTLKFMRVKKCFFEEEIACDDILAFLSERFKSVLLFGETADLLKAVSAFSSENAEIYLHEDNPVLILKALEKWGITVFVSPGINTELALFFGGKPPTLRENTLLIDFTGKFKTNTVNTNYIKDISLKTYTQLKKILPDIRILSILQKK